MAKRGKRKARGPAPVTARPSAPLIVPPEKPASLIVFAPVLVAVAVLGFMFACFDIDDPDLWWQLRAGRWMVEHHGPPRTEVFTYTREGLPGVDVEWGAELLLYLVMRAGGTPGLIVLVGAVAVVVASALVLAAREEGTGPASAGLATGVALFILHFRLYPRAEVFTLLCFSLLLLLLALWRRRPRWTLVGIPLLFLVWGNLHPGVLAGGLVLACRVGAEAVARFVSREPPESEPRQPLLPLFIASVVAALALLVNPYGVRAPLEWVRLAGSDINQYIVEWVPPTHELFTHRPFVQAYRVATAFVVISLPILWMRRRLGLAVAVAAILPMAMRSVRIVAVYGIATAPAMAVALHGWFTLATRRRAPRLQKLAGLAVSVVLLVVAGLVVEGSLYRWEGEVRRFGFGVNTRDFPVQALAFARANDISGTVYNEYRWGGWLGWNTGMKVFHDARTIDESLFREASMVMGTTPGFERILRRHGVDVMFLRYPKEATRSKALFQWLAASPDWALVFWDDISLVYVKRLPRFQQVIDRFGYRHLFPFEGKASMATLQNDWARVQAEVVQVKTWSPGCLLIRQIAGQLYTAFGMMDRARAEYVEGYRLDATNPFWEPRLRELGAWPPR